MITMSVLDELLQQYDIKYSVYDLYPIISKNMKYSDTLDYAYSKMVEESKLPEAYQSNKAKHEEIIKQVINEAFSEIQNRREEERLKTAQRRKEAEKDYLALMHKMEELAPFVETALTSAAKYGSTTNNIRRTWEELKRYFVGMRF